MDFKTHVKHTRKGYEGFPIVEVIWQDAMSGAVHNWEEKVSKTTMETTTVGYLVHEDETSLTIASLINRTHVGHTLAIPKGCIHERFFLGRLDTDTV